jgi:tetratricopeptide (TPR) repeat protein/tRNA A-37 threonylcarbamoyl transferase component Bud32
VRDESGRVTRPGTTGNADGDEITPLHGELRADRQRPLEAREQAIAARLGAALFPGLDASLGLTHVGRYALVRELGAGAMGVVYEARDPELSRDVAIKLLRDEGIAGSQHRLAREARALATLVHPRIVSVFDIGVHARPGSLPVLFVVMELVRGGTVSQWLARARPTWRAVLDVFIEAGRGLQAAHAAGVMHRDFKPANVLLTAEGAPKVADFGLSRIRSENAPESTGEVVRIGGDLRTHSQAVLGTPAYMAPEVLRGDPPDERADQYAFCVSLWEGLVGKRPFPSAATLQQLWETRGRAPVAPTVVPAAVFDVLARGLAPEPADRWPDLEMLLDALQRAARGRRSIALLAAAMAIAAGATVWSAVTSPPTANADAIEATAAATIDPSTSALLARASTLHRVGRHKDALVELDARRAVVPDDDDPNAIALDAARGYSLRVLGRHDDARSTLEAAYFAAKEGDDPITAAAAALDLAALARDGGAYEDASRWLEFATAHVQLVPEQAYLAARLAYARALTLDPSERTAALQTVAQNFAVLSEPGPIDDADVLTSIGWEQTDLGEVVAARESFARALALWHKRADPPPPGVGHVHAGLARLAERDGQLEEAATHQARAIAAARRFGELHPRTARAHNNLGNVELGRERYEQAAEQFERARRIYVAIRPADHPDIAMCDMGLAAVAFGTRRYADAVEAYRGAAGMLERHYGADAPEVSPVLANLGHALHRAGHPDDGVRTLERALSLLAVPTDPLVVARINLYLADALADADRLQDGRQAAQRARTAYAKVTDRFGRVGMAEVDRWLAAHPASPR